LPYTEVTEASAQLEPSMFELSERGVLQLAADPGLRRDGGGGVLRAVDGQRSPSMLVVREILSASSELASAMLPPYA
jgi:hypothetical protein